MLRALITNWPYIPGGEKKMASGLDCAVILVRTILVMFAPEDLPLQGQDDDDILNRYVWAFFDPRADSYERKLKKMRSAAYAELSRRMNARLPTFSDICRSQFMIDTIWNHPSGNFMLTHPVVVQGPGAPGGRIVRDRLDIARQGLLSWNGVAPSTVTELVNGVAQQGTDNDGNTTFVRLHDPWVLQVDLYKDGASNISLLDIWRFEADFSISELIPGSDDLYRFKQEKRCYAIMAIVRCRDKRHRGEDHIRIFDEIGEEVLPDMDAQVPPIWGWGIDEPIPAGERMHIFYRKVNSIDLPRPRERLSIVRIPYDRRVMMEDLALGPGSKETDEASPPGAATDVQGTVPDAVDKVGQSTQDKPIRTGPKADAQRGDGPIPTVPRAESTAQQTLVSDLQAEVRTLTGKVESLSNELLVKTGQLETQTRKVSDLQVELDTEKQASWQQRADL